MSIPHFFFPKAIHNSKNHIISLGELSEWLAEQALDLGVDVITGFAAEKAVLKDNKVVGVLTKDFGLDKNGKKTDTYEPGI